MKLKMFNFSASICQIPEQKPWKEDNVPPPSSNKGSLGSQTQLSKQVSLWELYK